MTTLRNEFDKINRLEDLQAFVTNTEDGESAILEFKSLQSDSFNNKNVGKTKAVLAKEICAFLNTNDGMILWGSDIDESTHKLIIKNGSRENLTNFLDTIKLTLTEPAPAGILFKSIPGKGENSALLIFVPKSEFAPHRVGSWDVDEGKKGKDKIIGRYFQRIGTSSQVMPENLVRSMYLSNGRLPTIIVKTMLDKITSPNKLILSTAVIPDKFDFIESYYLVQEFALVGNWLNIFDPEHIWYNLDDYDIPSIKLSPIFPSEEPYILWDNSILSDKNSLDQEFGLTMPDGNMHLEESKFKQIFAIATRTGFAAKGIPIKYKTCLFIIGPQSSWNLLIKTGQSKEQFRRVARLQELEDEYGAEVYISELYKDNEILEDRPANTAEPDNMRLKMSHIEQLLKNLTD